MDDLKDLIESICILPLKLANNQTSTKGEIKMENKMGHTPTPWRVNATNDGEILAAKYLVALTYSAVGKESEVAANAEFITRACNSHEDLIKIAQAYYNVIKAGLVDVSLATANHITDTIAKAEGK